jgi:hypothetical protein
MMISHKAIGELKEIDRMAWPAGSGSDASEYAHSLHSTVEGASRAGRLRQYL